MDTRPPADDYADDIVTQRLHPEVRRLEGNVSALSVCRSINDAASLSFVCSGENLAALKSLPAKASTQEAVGDTARHESKLFHAVPTFPQHAGFVRRQRDPWMRGLGEWGGDKATRRE